MSWNKLYCDDFCSNLSVLRVSPTACPLAILIYTISSADASAAVAHQQSTTDHPAGVRTQQDLPAQALLHKYVWRHERVTSALCVESGYHRQKLLYSGQQ